MYMTTLALFDKVLADINWPQDDHALPSEMITDTEAATDEDNLRASELAGERNEGKIQVMKTLYHYLHTSRHTFTDDLRATLRALRAKLPTTPHTEDAAWTVELYLLLALVY